LNKAKALKLCRADCSLEGCTKGSTCPFEHVKGLRTLSKADKLAMRDLIASHNLNSARTGFATLTADPSVVGV